MIYIDPSSLLKLVIPDEYSTHVGGAVAAENRIYVSSLTQLETLVQIRAMHLGGIITATAAGRIRDKLALMLASEPFVCRDLSGLVFKTAIHQHEKTTAHCRTLDRLHLAAMEEIGVRRLMTHDRRQAEAAVALGYKVVSPGWVGA
jgi:predicted nucleic acid-binding protein